MGINAVTSNPKVQETQRAAASAAAQAKTEAAQKKTVFAPDTSDIGGEISPYENYGAVQIVRHDWQNMNLAESNILANRTFAYLYNQDLSALSDIEKYDYVLETFTASFGEGVERAPYSPMNRALDYYFGLNEKYAVNRERLYGDMTDTEVQKAIFANFPEAKNMTLRDLRYMTEELCNVGLGDGFGIFADHYEESIYNDYSGTAGLQNGELLDKRINWGRVLDSWALNNNSASAASDPIWRASLNNAGTVLANFLGLEPSAILSSGKGAYDNMDNLGDMVSDALAHLYGGTTDRTARERENLFDKAWDRIFDN
jgi:hypothetical protein